jgi:hypothetical protein
MEASILTEQYHAIEARLKGVAHMHASARASQGSPGVGYPILPLSDFDQVENLDAVIEHVNRNGVVIRKAKGDRDNILQLVGNRVELRA